MKLDQAQFASDVRRMMKLTNKSMEEVLQEQAGLFVRDAIKFTPPFGKAPITESFTKQRKAGEVAIVRDILGGGALAWERSNPKAGIFTVLSDDQIAKSGKRERSGNRIVHATKAGIVYGVDAEHWKVDAPLSELLSHHENMRSKATGRVTSAGARTRDVGRWRFLDKFIIRQSQYAKLSKALFARVGMAKSGWVTAATQLRGKMRLPAWITRHAKGNLSGIYAKTGTGDKVSFLVGNGVQHAQRWAAHIEERAWKNRIRNFSKQVDQTARAIARKLKNA